MVSENSRFTAICSKVADVADLAANLYGVDLSQSSVSFKLRGRVAGQASCKICNGRPQVAFKFNCELVMGKHFEDIQNFTVAHELAHGVCFLRPDLGRNHDAGWKKVCLALGGNGNARHDYDVIIRGRWDYITDRGNKVSVTTRCHNKVQQGYTRLEFRRGLGSINKNSPFAPSGQPISAKSNTPPVDITPAKMPTVDPTQTKAHTVRQLVANAKNTEVSQESVVEQVIAVLGMTRQLAKTYVKNNWHKV